MFSFFSKKKHSPGDSPEETSLSSNPRPDDEYVVVNPPPGGQPANSLYPSINPGPPGSSGTPYPLAPYPVENTVAPSLPKKEVNFLQGVPFSLCKELTTTDNSEMISIQISEIMAFMTGRLQMETTEYDFSVEKSVLLENCS